MLIECLIKREGPTQVNYAGRTYRFEDDGTGAKVCDVNSDEHRAQLISTGFYQIYDPRLRGQVEKEAEVKAKREETALKTPVNPEQTPEMAIGLITRQFMPLGKDRFAKWISDNAEQIRTMPAAAKDAIIGKHNKLFPDTECPVTA